MKRKRFMISSYKKKIILYILFPVLMTVLLFSTLNFYLLDNVNKQLLVQCKLGHTSFSSAYDQEFQELTQNSILLMKNQSFRSLYFDLIKVDSTHHYLFGNAVEFLSAFASTKPYILQVGYINYANNRFISSAGTVFLEDFYDNSAYGTVVNKTNYLDKYEKSGAIMEMQKLDTKYKQTVIPILQYQIAEYSVQSPLIIFISKSSLSAELKNYRITPGSELFIYSKKTKQIIASSKTALEDDVLGVLPSILSADSDLEKVSIHNDNYYAISTASESNYCDPLIYISLVPKADITQQTTSSWFFSVIVLIASCAMTIILSYLFSFRLYRPVQGILHTINPNNTDTLQVGIEGDELNFLDHHIKELLHSNSDLQNTMVNALPTLYTRYIFNILYEETYANADLEPILQKYSLPFPHTYFSCSILVPKFMPEFYVHFTKAEQIIIKHQLSEILAFTRDKSCAKYVFLLEDEQFCIITNSLQEDATDFLTKDFEMLQNLFSFDENYIKLYLAIGKTCETIQNLHISWKQANIALSQISSFGDVHIQFFKDTPMKRKHYCMNPADDNHLSTYLYQGNTEAALELTKDIIDETLELGIEEDGLKDLYVHLYEIGARTLRQTKIDGQELLATDYVNISTFIHCFSNYQRSAYIQLFYKRLCQTQSDTNSSTFNLAEIKQYIDEHFSEDIYLESLAEMYHTSPKYMSHLLKQALGTPFKQYISTLRISKSKDMLSDTNMKIEEIATAVGINSRNTFIRTFKQFVGMTPSEYRAYVRK